MKSLLRHWFGKSLFITIGLFWLETGLAFAQPIRVVATFPDLADITRHIGKELVNVDSLATGIEDPHGVPMKPSFVPRLNRADVLVLTGLDDEHSWLPALLDVSNNPKILLGRPGYIDICGAVPGYALSDVIEGGTKLLSPPPRSRRRW